MVELAELHQPPVRTVGSIICLFFFAEANTHGAKATDRLKLIVGYFQDKTSKLYAHFLSYSLPIFTNANLLVQKEELVLHLLQARLHDVATDLLVAFVKPSVTAHASNLYQIEHHHLSKQKERAEPAIGKPLELTSTPAKPVNMVL